MGLLHYLATTCLTCLVVPQTVHAWLLRPTSCCAQSRIRLSLASTPFEADLYNIDDNDDNPFAEVAAHPLAVPDTTRLVVGLNKDSHDVALCAADAETGRVLYAQAKERVTRRKHDAGNVAALMETCLDALQLTVDHIDTVVMNNHHHRVLPREADVPLLEWEAGLCINGGQEDGSTDDEHLLPDVSTKLELSHHLAHAYSAATQAPFDQGLLVVMDGMGETYRTMQEGRQDPHYISDYDMLATTTNDDDTSMQCVPSNLPELAATSRFDWREAESVYIFDKSSSSGDDKDKHQLTITPIFKRFTQEHSPPTLYNHGFENMDSLGALYSRASSHIFGDWNACGKVMGLAPWAHTVWTSDDDGTVRKPPLHDAPIVQGHLYQDEGLTIDRTLLKGMPLMARQDPELFSMDGSVARKRYDFDTPERIPDYDSDESSTTTTFEETDDLQRPTQVALEAIALAHRMQGDLETVALDFVQHFQQKTGQDNLVLAGGVALNSVLNGRLSRELGFAQTFVPPYPGDDGIAVGCCAYGLFGTPKSSIKEEKQASRATPKLWQEPLSPYLGGVASEMEIKSVLERAAPWIEVEVIRNDEQRFQRMVDEIASGGVIAWYRSRSEMGPRALGNRSILADPRKHGLVRVINEHVKKRESFRPFAPSALAEHAQDWFELGSESEGGAFSNASPYMSLTALVKEHQRHKIPAVTHVDGSSRLQTVTKEAEPIYHAFISQFYKATGIPMVLNTSFNTIPKEPIVETPLQAIRSFLFAEGALEMLILDDYVITRKTADLRKLLGEVEAASPSSDVSLSVEPSCPKRVGPVSYQASFSLPEGPAQPEEVITTTLVQMPDRMLHVDGEWHELLDELEGELLSICDGSTTLNEILAHYTSVPADDENKKVVEEETQQLLQNIVARLARLHDLTFLYW